MPRSAATGNKHVKSDIGPFTSVVFGLQVMAAEGKWLLLKAIRTFEINRLNKRLEQEYTLLGQQLAGTAATAAPDTIETLSCQDPQTKITLKQIAFLREEIAYLERDKENMRQEFYERRRKKLGAA